MTDGGTWIRPDVAYHEEAEGIASRARGLKRRARRFRGVIYRSVEPEYARREDRLQGIGAAQFGGRWNPIGLAALYGSTSVESATAEALAKVRHYGFDDERALPRTIFVMEAKLTRVLDLTDGDIRRRLRVSEARMRACPWREENDQKREALTQAIGRAAYEAGFEAIRVPSFALRDHANLVVYPGAVSEGQLRVLNADAL